MAVPSFLNRDNIAAALQGLATGLIGYGSGNPNAGLLAINAVGNERDRRFHNARLQALMDRQASQDAYELQKRQEEAKRRQAASDALRGIVSGQPGMPNNGRPGGMGTPARPPSMSFDPSQSAIIQAMGDYDPESALALVGRQAFEKPKVQEPYSPLAKLKDDLMHGRISQREYDAAVKKETWITPPAQTTVNVGPTGINYGDPEPGLAWARNPDGTVKTDERGLPIAGPYQGSKAYIAAQEAAASGETKTKLEQQTANVVTDSIKQIKEQIAGATLPTTGTFGPLISQLPGSAANNVRALLVTIKGNVGIDKLQQMRNASKTGGALGAVNQEELNMLQSALGALEQSTTPDLFNYNLDRVNKIYNLVINGPGDKNKSPSDMTDQELLDELNK